MITSYSDLLVLAQAEEWWSEHFFGLGQEQRFALLIVGIGCATGIILGLAGIIFAAVNSFHRRRVEIGLKRELVERGMSADEITKIIESAPPPEDATGRWIASWGKCNKQ